MGKKSRIQPRKPSPPPRPKVVEVEPKKVLSEFRGDGPVRLKRSRYPSGPKIGGYTCTATWNVVVSDADVEAYLMVAEALGNTRKLFHGTPSHNVASITREGLYRSGSSAMFGPGVYFGMPQKAIGYTRPGWRGEARYLFEAEVALGKCLRATSAHKYNLKKLEEVECHSVHGARGQTASWGGTLKNDEWVVFSREQILLDKLHEYQPTHEMTQPEPTSGSCSLIIDKPPPVLSKKNRAFKDILSRQVCGRTGHTKLHLEGHRPIWVCTPCIKRDKLRIGSKISLSGYAGKEYTYRIKSQN